MGKTIKTGIGLLVVTVAIAGVAAYIYGNKLSTKPEKITLAVSPQTLCLSAYVAYARGFFEREGLQVIWKPYESGRDAFKANMEGAADLSVTGETPLMFAGLEGERFFIIATIADSNKYMKIVARRSLGIFKPTDLKGKTIAVGKGATTEYFLQAFLTFNGIARDRVRTVYMSPTQMTEPLLRGDIDAAVNPPPQATEQERRLGTDSITFENQQLYRGTWNLVGRPEFVKAHPDAVKKLLRALIQAEHYMVQNPDDARKITTDYIGKDAPDLSDYNYDVRIDRALLVSLEEQARWAISAGLSDKREIPNYLTFFYPDDLEAVAPESVALR